MANYKLLNGKMVKVEERKEDALTLQFKGFLKAARNINKSISLMYNDETAKYDILLDEETYKAGISPDDVEAELVKLGEALKKRGIIRIKDLKEGHDADARLSAEIFVNSNVHKLISMTPTEDGYFVVFIPKGWREMLAAAVTDDEEDEDDLDF